MPPLPNPHLAEVSFYVGDNISRLFAEKNNVENNIIAAKSNSSRSFYQNSNHTSFSLQRSNEHSKTKIDVLTDESLFQQTGVRIAFTSRNGGVSIGEYNSFNLANHVGDDATLIGFNRKILLDAMGAQCDIDNIINPKQIHSDYVLCINNKQDVQNVNLQEADAIVCSAKNIPVLLCFADCASVICVAPNGCFAVIHAGWRGCYAKIAKKAILELERVSECSVYDCNCYIGPHIRACCFEVSSELSFRFAERFGKKSVVEKNNNITVDLSFALYSQLIEAGVDRNRIIDSEICTKCNVDSYFSYRAENGKTGRHSAYAYKFN